MDKLVKKTFVQAAARTLLFFAITHVVILILLSILTGNISYLNVFYILGITEFIEGVDKGTVSNVLSVIFTAGVFFFFLKSQRKRR